MKIVTYNVNGLRQRVNQFGSLLKLLNSFDADIICFQETKLRRQEITSDLAIADGYESFFSCTRTNDRGRTGYSGVATFCRVKSAFSSTEVALPVAAEEGFTGLVDGSMNGRGEIAQALEEYDRDELVKVDSEGRCVITDHGHFVLFNIYGPRADGDDTERVQFKLKFYKMLQKRWESLLHQGRRVFVVGDLNIAPTAMDRCEAGPDFEKNEFRRWLRSMLVGSGGAFSDVFRSKHPDRREAYTCWSSSTGAEQFNYGSRIDHILCAGSCLHQEHDSQGHNFVTCHVKDCDILTEYKRWKPGSTPSTHRWKGGLNIKLEGSDHAPVFMSLIEIPDIVQHGTPSLSSRYLPMIRGLQQTIVSVLMKSQAAVQVQSQRVCSSFTDGNVSSSSYGESKSSSLDNCGVSGLSVSDSCPLFGDSDGQILETDEQPKDFTKDARPNTNCLFQNENINSSPAETAKKKARKGHQLSLRSFFQKSSNHPSNGAGPSNADDISLPQAEIQDSSPHSNKTPVVIDKSSNPEHYEVNPSTVTGDECEVGGCSLEEKKSCALLEWQRIQRLMRNSLPLCKGHKEPCVSRIVKKPGPTFGRRFYVCARAEGPVSNPEANCGYFKWASLKSRQE